MQPHSRKIWITRMSLFCDANKFSRGRKFGTVPEAVTVEEPDVP
jgi:hypothetical protein